MLALSWHAVEIDLMGAPKDGMTELMKVLQHVPLDQCGNMFRSRVYNVTGAFVPCAYRKLP